MGDFLPTSPTKPSVASITGKDARKEDQMFVLVREETFELVDATNTPHTVNRSVRRPIGVEFKQDTFAYMEVLRTDVQPNGDIAIRPINIFNENHPGALRTARGMEGQNTTAFADKLSGLSSNALRAASGIEGVGQAMAAYTNNFVIQSFEDMREEKIQIIETFGDNFIFFFGERPRFVTVSGLLLNANSHQWEKEFWLNYETYLRGTRAVENKSIVNLHADGRSVSGYLISASATKNAQNPRQVPFSFRMIITDSTFENDEYEPDNTVRFFAESVGRHHKKLNGLLDSESSGFDRLASVVENGLDKITGILEDGLIQKSVGIVTQAMFGNPTGAITDGIAAAVNIFELASGDFGELSQSVEFNEGLGSLVEFRGRAPLMLQTSKGGPTLGKEAKDNLVASVDNSLSILLDIRQSPVMQMLGLVSGLIDNAIEWAFGAGAGLNNGKIRSKWLDITGASNLVGSAANARGAITGRFMGVDFTLPIKGGDITTVGPANSDYLLPETGGAPVGDVSGVAAGTFPFGVAYKYKFTRIPIQTGSGIQFNLLKLDPGYGKLPRAWRLRIEKDPDSISAKLLSVARPHTDDQLYLIIRQTDQVATMETNISEKIRALTP